VLGTSSVVFTWYVFNEFPISEIRGHGNNDQGLFLGVLWNGDAGLDGEDDGMGVVVLCGY
jgi:hypothetical protein